MKVAIIGAGMSGLSCAIELKKHGINPTIYEKLPDFGDVKCDMCVSLKIFNNIYGNIFKSLSRKNNLELDYRYKLKKIIINTANNHFKIKGSLGHIAARGIWDPDSIGKQLGRLLNLPVLFNTPVKIDDIKGEYDHIVVATGVCNIAKQLNNWEDIFTAYYTSAFAPGEFQTDTIIYWCNKKYAKNSFAYLVPVNEKLAYISLIVDGIKQSELDYYWSKFLSMENIDYKIFRKKNSVHTCGTVFEFKTRDNIYFVGNSGGFTDNFMGFGMHNAVISGITAGKCIAQNLDFNKLAINIAKPVKALKEYRNFIENFTNKDYDNLASFLKIPVIKQMIYNNPFFKVSHMSPVIKLLNNMIFRIK